MDPITKDKLNRALNRRQQREEANGNSETETTASNILSSEIKTSEFLKLRTARYWADVEAGKSPIINFFKMNGDRYEIHNNATEGIAKVVDLDRLHEVFKETAWELSYIGRSDIAVFKQDNKQAVLKIEKLREQTRPDGTFLFYHGLVNFDLGTAPWIMTKKFYYNDKDEVIVENVPYLGTNIEGSLEWRQLPIDKFNKKYKTSWVETINLGKTEFPVIKFTNTGQDRNGNGLSDWAEAVDLLTKIDNIDNAIDRAAKAAKTRVFSKRVNNTMNLRTGSAKPPAMAQQLADDVDLIEIYEDPTIEGGSLQFSDRNFNIDGWDKLKRDYKQDYYAHTGENIQEDHKNNQHGTEIQSKGDNKFRRATAKRTRREYDLVKLVNVIMSISKASGQNYFSGVDKVFIKIDEVDIRKEIDVIDKAEKLLDLGLISKVQALMKIESIDEATAMMMLGQKDKHDKINPVEQEMDLVGEMKASNHGAEPGGE